MTLPTDLPGRPVPAPGQPLIKASGLVRYDSIRGENLLDSVDFSLYGADRVAITGPSGSGKSVFLRALSLLDPLASGQILWRNTRVRAAEVPAYRRHVSYIAQRPALLDGTVEDNLRYPFSLKVYQDRTFDRDAALRLAEHAGRNEGFLDKQSSELSGGEAQIAALIRVLQLQPDVLLLDEPTAALDPESATEIEVLVSAWFNAAQQAERAYVWVSHDQQQALRMSTRQFAMQAGRLSEPNA